MALSQRPRRQLRRRPGQQNVTQQGFSLLTAMGAATDRDGAIQALTSELSTILAAQQCTVVLFGSAPTIVSTRRQHADREPSFRFEAQGPLAHWLRNEQQILVRHADGASGGFGLRRDPVPADAPAMIAAPILRRKRIAGYVGVCCDVLRRWRPAEIALVEAGARQLGHTLDRLEQLDAFESRARLLTAVHDAATRSASEAQLPAALQTIAEQARQLANADIARLTLYEHGSTTTAVEAHRTGAPCSTDGSGRVPSERNALNVINVPLTLADRMIGVLELNRVHSSTPFTVADETLLQLFAPYATAAINMAEQHARLEHLLKDLAQLTRGTDAAADTSASIAAVAEAGRRLLGADACVVVEQTPRGPLARHATGCSDDQLAALLSATATPDHEAGADTQPDHDTGCQELAGLADIAWCAALPLTASGGAGGKVIYAWQQRPAWQSLRPAAEIVANQLGQLLTGSALYHAAQEATRLKFEFMSTVSHELRTPMGAIIGYTELLANNLYGAIPGTMRDPLVRLKANAAQLLQQINQILDLSRIEAGRLELHVAPFQPRDLVRSVTDALHEDASAKGLDFSCTVAPDVPAIAMGDVGRLRQILLNLVGNSIKFTQHGSIELRCMILAAGTNRELAFVVRDTGPGIAPDEQDSIWQPFRQGQHAAGHERSGTGLGLAIVHKLTELMRGRVCVESRLGQGSIFTVRLPLARP